MTLTTDALITDVPEKNSASMMPPMGGVRDKLFIGNLPRTTTGDDLRTSFTQAGAVAYAMVITDLGTGLSKGLGFVKMTNPVDAERAIRLFDAYHLDERPLTVELAEMSEEHTVYGQVV